MTNDLTPIERELTGIEKNVISQIKDLEEVGEGFFTSNPAGLERVDSICIYNSRNRTSDLICSERGAKELREHLNWFFQRGAFNVLYLELNNPKLSRYLLANIRSQEDLNEYMDLIQKEIKEERYPIKYFISKVLGVNRSAKWRTFQ